MSSKVQNNWDKSEQSFGSRTPLLDCTNVPNSVGEKAGNGKEKKIKGKGK